MLLRYFNVAIMLFGLTVAHAASHQPQTFLDSIRGSKTEGAQIRQHYCAMCHAEKPMVSLGAPRIGQLDDWAMRMKQGMDTLFQHADEGFNAMPARGGCFECSDEQLRMAILSMLPLDKRQIKKP
jgi:cytochrome c5